MAPSETIKNINWVSQSHGALYSCGLYALCGEWRPQLQLKSLYIYLLFYRLGGTEGLRIDRTECPDLLIQDRASTSLHWCVSLAPHSLKNRPDLKFSKKKIYKLRYGVSLTHLKLCTNFRQKKRSPPPQNVFQSPVFSSLYPHLVLFIT